MSELGAGILYLHGFCSSPESWKAKLLGDALRDVLDPTQRGRD